MATFPERWSSFTRAAVGLFSSMPRPPAADMMVGILPGGRGEPPARGARDILAAYGTLPILRAVSSKIAAICAAVPWELYGIARKKGAARRSAELQAMPDTIRRQTLARLQEAGEVRRIDDHPYLDLWDHPNPMLSSVGVRRLVTLYLDLPGEVMLLKVRNRLGLPVELWPIPSYWVLATPTPTFPFYRMSFRGWQEEIAETEVLWIKDPHPWNPYTRGTGTAQALTDELETDEYTAKFIKAFYYNGARPDLIISADNLGAGETMQLEQEWNQKNQGWWRAFRAHFFNRKVDVQQLTQNFQHLQLTDLRRFERDVVIQTYGCPPELFGITESSNRATMQMADVFVAKHVIIPRMELQRAALQEHLLPEWDERLILGYTSPIPRDTEQELEQAKAAPWSLMVDEWRMLQGLDPLPNKTGQVFMIPTGLTPYVYGDPLPTVEPGTGTAANEDETPQAAAKHVPLQVHRALTEAPQTLDAVARDHEAAYVAMLLAAFSALRQDVDTAQLNTALASGHATLARDAIPWEAFAAALGGLLFLNQQALAAGATVAAGHLATTLQLPSPFTVDTYTSLRARKRVQQATGATIYGLVERTQAAVTGMIEEGLSHVWPAVTIALAIQTILGLTAREATAVDTLRRTSLETGIVEEETLARVATYTQTLLTARISRIAAQESFLAVSMGQQEAWDAAVLAGVLDPTLYAKVWHTEEDDRVCASLCQPMARVVRPLTSTFSLPDGSKAFYPPAHVVCRCHAVLVRMGL